MNMDIVMDVKSVAVAAPVAITQEATDQLMQIRREENIPTDYCLRMVSRVVAAPAFPMCLVSTSLRIPTTGMKSMVST